LVPREARHHIHELFVLEPIVHAQFVDGPDEAFVGQPRRVVEDRESGARDAEAVCGCGRHA
ncbi:MAG TPA: hypothetical protein VGI86_12005, partial [Acidimicrobiia bacterium]